MEAVTCEPEQAGSAAMQPGSAVATYKLERGVHPSDLALQATLNVVRENAAHFTARPLRSNKFLGLFQAIEVTLESVRPVLGAVAAIAPFHDVDAACPGNGFRSLLQIACVLLENMAVSGRECTATREKLFFKADTLFDSLDGSHQAILQLQRLLAAAERVAAVAGTETLFLHPAAAPAAHAAAMQEIETVDATHFYGELAAFQYPGTLGKVLRTVLLAMCGYAEGYQLYQNKAAQLTVSTLMAGKMLFNAEERAHHIVTAFRTRNPRFVRAFWNLLDTTMLRHIPKIVSARMAVNRVLLVPGVALAMAGPAATPAAVLLVPGVTGIIGELEAAGGVVDRAKVLALQLRFMGQLLSATEKDELVKVALAIKVELDTSGLAPAEGTLLRGNFFQAFAQQVEALKARADRAEARAAAAAAVAVGSPKPPRSWKDRAGRRTGDETYKLGDLSLALLNKLTFGTKSIPKPQLSGDVAAGRAVAHAHTIAAVPHKHTAPLLVGPRTGLVDSDASDSEVETEVADDVAPGEAMAWSDVVVEAAAAAADSLNVFGTIRCRLLSYSRFQGQVKTSEQDRGSVKGRPASPSLLVHFHGGGFLSSSSQSHESYLRMWAKELACPVFSVDYTLATDAPFPRAMHECFHAYAWAVTNADKLGSTADRVCVAGDSAGGNLCVAVTLRALMEGVRAPDAVVAFYPALNVQASFSPARCLSIMDPLLNMDLLRTVVDSYAGSHAAQDPLLSPLFASDALLRRLPLVYILAVALDPLLDDSVQFARRLKQLGVKFKLSIVPGMPHGFLNFKDVSPATQAAHDIGVAWLKEALTVPAPSCTLHDRDAGDAVGF